jgi:hypothetical protein
MILPLSNYYPGDLIKNEKGGACGTYGGERRNAYRFLLGTPDEKRRLETTSVKREDYIETDC